MADNLAEMNYLERLRSFEGIQVPHVIRAKNGEKVVVVHSDYTPTPKRMILYRWMEGELFDGKEDMERFRQVGTLMAKMHAATKDYVIPNSIQAKRWDQVFYFHDEKAVYHEKKHADKIKANEIALLDHLIPILDHKLASYYQESAPQFIHGDINPWNLLVDSDEIKVIDFDDAQMGFPIFDLAIFLFYYRYDENFNYDQIKAAVFAGYELVQPLPVLSDYNLELLMAARRVNFINYVLYMDEDVGDYITRSCNRLRDFLDAFHIE